MTRGRAGRTVRAGTRAIELTSIGLALAGCVLLAHAAWIPAKAWLAGHLIERAWLRSAPDASGAPARPWPWADTWPIARLLRAGEDHAPLYVLAGANGEALAFGPAHLSSSAAPGSAGHVVLAGHRDTHFAFLRELAVGDPITLETHVRRVTYVVDAMQVVHESRTDLVARSGRAELTLVTCYPFDAIVPGGPLRYVVSARAMLAPAASTRPRGADSPRARSS